MTTRRHGAAVTADRLADALNQWPDRFTKDDTEQAEHLLVRLRAIAAHDRTDIDDGWRCSCGAAAVLPGIGKAQLDRLFTEHATSSTKETP